MKVILLNDVPRLGRKYDTKTVADGYGRNYLILRGLAKIATDKAIKRVETLKKQYDEERSVQKDLLLKNLEGVNNITIVMREKANDKGHLFAGIHREEIVPVLKEQAHLDMDAEHIILEHPIKELGEHKIDVKVDGQKATFTLAVEESGK